MKPAYPVHRCRIDNPCPVLAGTCEGPDPSKWSRPSWLNIPRVLHLDEGHLSRRRP